MKYYGKFDTDYDLIHGGEATHTLTVSEIPSHSHSYNNTSTGSSSYGLTGTYDVSVVSTSSTTGSTGGDGAHNNLLPYYALCYIMKS